MQASSFSVVPIFVVAYLLILRYDFPSHFPVPFFFSFQCMKYGEMQRHEEKNVFSSKMIGISGKDFTFPSNRTVMLSFDEFAGGVSPTSHPSPPFHLMM
jgi:hypothetical protein